MPLLLLLLLLFVAPVQAAEWERYSNPRFGYTADIPPGFSWDGIEPANADGRTFRNARGTQRLTLWGGHAIEGSFETHAEAAIALAEQGGWSISYRATTPGWSSFSGLRNGQVLYGRDIALCDGTGYASFRLEYPQRDIGSMNAVVEQMVMRFTAQPGGRGCRG